MASNAKDLDLLVGDPIPVKLAGHEYLLPADVPIPVALRLEQLADDGTSDEDAARLLYGEILKLFQVHQPDIDQIPLSGAQLAGFFTIVYGAGSEPEPEPDPTPAAGTKSSRRRSSKAGSRSSGSSSK